MIQREKSLASVKVVALGDIGNRIISQLDSSKINPDISVILMNDTVPKVKCPWDKTYFGITNCQLTEHQKTSFLECLLDTKVLIILADTEDRMTTVAPVIAEHAKQQGVLTICLVIKSADTKVAQQLSQSCDAMIPVDTDILSYTTGDINRVVCETLEGLLYIACNYEWKLQFLRDHGGDVRMATFKSRGASCVANIVHDMVTSPLLGDALQRCRHMLRFYFLAPHHVSLSDSAELGLAITEHSNDACEVDGAISFSQEEGDDDIMLILLVAN